MKLLLLIVAVVLVAPLHMKGVLVTGRVTQGVASNAVAGARVTLFTPDLQLFREQRSGANGCGMRAFADSQGAVYILYRAATEMTERGETLLVSRKPGADFEVAYSHPWKAMTCPMSSASLAEGKSGVVAAWETGDNVFFASVDPKTMQVSRPVAPMAGLKRKHPVGVANSNGETLFVWTEGTAWAKGGSVGWQIFSQDGNAIGDKPRSRRAGVELADCLREAGWPLRYHLLS